MRVDNCLYKYIWLVMALLPLTNVGLFICNGNIAFADYSWYFFLQQFAICIAVALAEELFFRGLLLRELVFNYKWRAIKASLLVSLAFGFLHLVNVNSYATLGYAIVQSVCAFAVSFNLSAIFIRTQSLWICVLVHALINITSIGLDIGNHDAQLFLSSEEAIIFLLVSFTYLVCGIKMLNHMAEGD